jgi:hypothetical protein
MLVVAEVSQLQKRFEQANPGELLMDRRAFFGLSGAGLLQPRRERQGSKAGSDSKGRLDYDWIEDIKHGGSYRLLRTALNVDAVFLSPPDERGGPLRLDFAEWKTYSTAITTIFFSCPPAAPTRDGTFKAGLTTQ